MRRYSWCSRLVAVGLAALEVFACSDSEDPVTAPADAGNADSHTECGLRCTADTGLPGEDAADDADSGPAPGKGTITIGQNVPPPDAGDGGDAGTISTSASAQFTVGGSSYCTAILTAGPCEVTECNIFGGSSVENVSAGDVTVAGATLPDGGTVLAVVDGGTYASSLGDVPLFTGTETYAVSATGGIAPAFSVTNVPGVKGVTLTAPALSTAGLNVPVNSPLTVTWTGGGQGNAHFEMVKIGPLKMATCAFPASGGSGEVPVAILQELSAGGAIASFHVENSVKADAGSFDLTIRVSAGRGDYGFLTLE
jgi:hypothetical protein